MQAPDFKLPDQEGKNHSLSDYRGKWLVLYFYPKDFTPGCTKEACAFRDARQEFDKRGVKIVGISKDTVALHKKFAEKYRLNFPLLADHEHQVIEAYGAWGKKKFMGREFFGILRSTFLINPKGEIVKEYKNVNPITHSSEILRDLEKFV
ncbi:MAG: Peroxiredoxin bcp [Candidatus Woesebacteria bacterium GW2011_GWC2_47_16]|uniref:thioredoxin-dependent peroxiredoxin n=9 Tax=Candidatus Woeseibacteriota TaxID=1752722 RepID=A0A0G1SZ16_9BACT|nr:MAG: Peroxiredoxin bcp [Candidatus Woesebacteria bacterium GW2011_GWE1_45_18]KKU23259.1 MAG: Peroxiredoxin bcp [Candidatus Woesebacteria bacterium GW2011_GWF1_46_13]KKU47173.1 MAG: Peroxiredoxin bcp [Candidatus Woesebacteria bacterium GW2011_GWF2_46_8]KKU63558.1 MAG: Peroxiredoxin bcp [Candidatus Woesebacteria bacterium GW2011_GWC2_47_16]KKU70597.1 MAG: Peroxiredoxin bcp [Candidatus Woesebacteria bacterium GW2011_GWD1_47_21]OGM78353.1 MAG: thiol peroxidase [Candidatus Woesebacteria bacteriu